MNGNGGTGKARERSVRRWANRLGFKVQKSRRKRVTYDDHGLYMLLMHTDLNSVVAGDRFTARLEDVETFLADEERRRGEPHPGGQATPRR